MSGQHFTNAPGDGAQGPIDMAEALEVSDDDFFYTMGEIMNPDPTTQVQGSALQTWARKFGVNQRPDIDIPYADAGTVPSPALVNTEIKAEKQCVSATGAFAYTNGTATSARKLPGYHRSPKHPDGCGIADPSTLGWTVGDNMQAAIGQGRRPDQPSAAGDGLLGDRERRHAGLASHRRGHPDPLGQRDPEDRPSARA